MPTTTATPTNLAQYKRYLQPGRKMRCVYQWWRERRFGDGTCDEIVTVQKLQTNAAVFEPRESTNGQASWLWFNKADDYEFDAEGVWHLDKRTPRDEPGKPRLRLSRYLWVAD